MVLQMSCSQPLMMNVQSYLKSTWNGLKSGGKMKRRMEAAKSPWTPPLAFDLSYNESVRLATDALLDSGPGAYENILNWEQELSFLSPSEMQYIVTNAEGPQLQEPGVDGEGIDAVSHGSDTYFPLESESGGPVLEQGWPMLNKRYYLKGPSNVSVYFQTQGSRSIKDVLRFQINQAVEVTLSITEQCTHLNPLGIKTQSNLL